MPNFTATLQQVIDYETVNGLTAYQAVGLDAYDIFDEEYRAALNDKIIAHFNEWEIGHETISMFRYAMARKMNELAPIFNQHYKANQIAIDPLLTVNIRTVAEGAAHVAEISDTTSETTATGRVVGSNTPQVRLSGNKDYAASAQDSISKTDASGNGSQSSDSTNTNDGTTTGYSGNPAELIFAMRQTFVNVDMMIIEQLQELFSLVWDNGEEFTKGIYNDYYAYGVFGLFR